MKYCPLCQSELVLDADREDKRLACPATNCNFVHWNSPVPVVAAIIIYHEQIMLVHHVNWPPKALALVTGFLEPGEDPLAAVQREVKEETNLDAIETELIGLYPFETQNQLIIAYSVKATGTIALNEELDRYKLLDFESVKPWPFGTGPAVADWLKRQRKVD